MSTLRIHALARLLGIAACTTPSLWLHSQPALQFTGVQRQTNKEIVLTLSAPAAGNYRIESAKALPDWSGLVTLPFASATSLQFTDSAAPFLDASYYRAEQVAATNVVGDHLATTNGEITMQPRYHATFVMSWNNLMIYSDPVAPATYPGLAKADLILVTHSHTDHFAISGIDAVRKTNSIIVVPQDVYNQLSAAQKLLALVLGYGGSTNVLGLTVQAVPAYNSYHPFGVGNGYVLTIGGKRIYISGDTGNTAEMRQLPNIDVAFLCINQPYTMTVTDATNAVTAFHPAIVYPYHYRDQSGATANAAVFKQRLSTSLGIEVRLRKWY